ncbi:MAG: hypothetical protein J6K31_05115 [Parabacteroides sp.]|nr:hypothetical protein [Parabacteroides sp.]
MKIENLNCHNYKVVGDTLTTIVKASSMDEIKTALFGKETLSITTDNNGTTEIVEELIGFEKGKSILVDMESNLFTVTITRKTDLEKRLEALEKILLPSENNSQPFSITVKDGTVLPN